MSHICFNGKILPAEDPVLLASNRGYRYGDGLFETMKAVNGRIQFGDDHFERLFSGLALLQYEIPAFFKAEKLTDEILRLCQRNNCEELARVRLSVSRGIGGLYDTDRKLNWLIECWPLSDSVTKINENGLVIGVYPGARKSCDKFGNLKSANFLPYSMAALYATANKWNDSLVLNTYERIADSTIANVFIIKDKVVSTPALTEGCVNGILRKNLLHTLLQENYDVQETALTTMDLANADEIFLTNAIQGIRWVRQLGEKVYSNEQTLEIYSRLFKTITA